MGHWEEDHRSKMPFSSHHIKSIHNQHDLWLGMLMSISSDGILQVFPFLKLFFFFLPFHTICCQPLMRGKLRATCHKLFEIILHRRLVHLLIYLFIYLSIIYFYQYWFIGIDFVLWVIIQYHSILLLKLSSFGHLQFFLGFFVPLRYIYKIYILFCCKYFLNFCH